MKKHLFQWKNYNYVKERHPDECLKMNWKI